MTRVVLTPLLLVAAVVVYAVPKLSPWLVYDRAAILSGEYWRLVTGHLVHFSPSHLIYNLLALGLAVGLLEREAERGLAPALALGTLVIPLSLFALAPEIQFYGGLSGLATVAIVLLGLRGLSQPGIWKVVGSLILAGFLVRLVVENRSAGFVFAHFDRQTLRSCPLGHATGALAALLSWSMPQRTPQVSRGSSSPLTGGNRNNKSSV